MNILALNAGSSSLKYSYFDLTEGDARVLAAGKEDTKGESLVRAANAVIEKCAPMGIDAIGHRIVHGGPELYRATRITPNVLATLRRLKDLDPLHNPTEVALIEAGQQLLPEVPEVAVFDTGFHHTLPAVAFRYALPRDVSERFCLRRYGFHGLSYRFVSEKLIALLGREPNGTRLIVCHLGSGASVCAIKDGISVDTSMGMTPLEGLVMGTRAGDVDSGLLLYWMQQAKLSPENLDRILNSESGLLGVSGSSADVRDLEKAEAGGNEHARFALNLFAYRVRKYIGSYAAVLGGVDAIAFTGGIGEHSPTMRDRICQNLSFLGIQLNDEANQAAKGDTCMEIDSGTVPVWVIPTDEEQQVARETYALLNS